MESNKTRDEGEANETSISSLDQRRFVFHSLFDENRDQSCRNAPTEEVSNHFLE